MSNTPSFQPSVEATQAALGPGAKIVKRAHPMGAEGVRVSLSEVAARIRRGMEDPMVVAWARRMIHENGSPQTTKERAQVLLTQLRKRVSYVPDPVGVEFMAQPRELLCLDPENKVLCFRGGDCDELVIAYASLTLAVGIPTQIIGESFNDSKIAEHVLCAIQDTEADEWLHVDPSTPKPVGEWVRGTSEEWIDPLNPKISGATTLGGNFVGVGAIGKSGTLGVTTTTTTGSSGLAIVGAVAAAGAIAGLFYLMSSTTSRDATREYLCYRGQSFSVKMVSDDRWDLDVGDELHVHSYDERADVLRPFTTRAQAIAFAKKRIDSSDPPRTQRCATQNPRRRRRS